MAEPQSPSTNPGLFPGANPGRLHGRYAICTFAGIGTLSVFDWTAEIHTDFADGTAHGDFWDVPVPLKYSWTARVRGYFSGTSTYLHGFNAAVGASPGDITAVNFVGYRDASSTNAVFTGSGYLVRAQFAANKNSMVEQEAEIRGTGALGTGVIP